MQTQTPSFIVQANWEPSLVFQRLGKVCRCVWTATGSGKQHRLHKSCRLASRPLTPSHDVATFHMTLILPLQRSLILPLTLHASSPEDLLSHYQTNRHLSESGPLGSRTNKVQQRNIGAVFVPFSRCVNLEPMECSRKSYYLLNYTNCFYYNNWIYITFFNNALLWHW